MTALHQLPDHLDATVIPRALRWRYRILALTFPLAWVLGTLGYLHYPHGPERASLSNALYHAAQLFLLHAPHFEGPLPWTLEAGRWLAALSTGWVLYAMATRVLRDARRDMRLLGMKGHAIVCGMGAGGLSVVRQLRQRDEPVVAVDPSPAPEAVEQLRKLNVPLVIEDPSLPGVWRQVRLNKARTLYALCAEDAANCAIATQAMAWASQDAPPRHCYVYLGHTELRHVLQNGVRDTRSLTFVDAFDPVALRLLAQELPLDHDGIGPDDPRQAHLVLVGFGRMGRALAVRAAQLGQFANGRRVRISVIDREAERHRDALLFHHPFIHEAADLDFHAIEMLSAEARAWVEAWCEDPDTLTSLVIGFDRPGVALEVAVQLRPLFERTGTRVAVRIPRRNGLARLLDVTNTSKSVHLHCFDLDDSFAQLASADALPLEKFARDIHAAYVAKRLAAVDSDRPADLPEELRDWPELKEIYRESNRQQAAQMYFKLRAMGWEAVTQTDTRPAITEFDAATVEVLAVMEHNRWLAERRMAGWRFGAPSDKPRRQSENLIPWEQLPEPIREHDRSAIRTIPALLASTGLKICRRPDGAAADSLES